MTGDDIVLVREFDATVFDELGKILSSGAEGLRAELQGRVALQDGGTYGGKSWCCFVETV